MELPIAETFTSVQGEGYFSGMPSFFIRVAGCNLRCRFCDTSFPTNGMSSIHALVEEAIASGRKHVVITGGEPSLYPAEVLTLSSLLAKKGFFVQIETNGYQDLRPTTAWITLSPKNSELCLSAFLCQEIKLLIDANGNPINKLSIDYFNQYKFASHHYFQPVDPSLDNLAAGLPTMQVKGINPGPVTSYIDRVSLAVKAILNLQATYPNWRLSLQLHKIYGWR